MATGRPPLNQAPPAVAGPGTPPAVDGPALSDQDERMAAGLEKLQDNLGGDTLLDVVEKLAAKDPASLRALVGYL